MDLRGALGSARKRLPGESVADPLRRTAGTMANVDRLPTELRAALGHYARGGRLDVSALRLQPVVEERVAEMVEDAFADVEAALAAEYGVDAEMVTFEYETKLLLPVELTLARLYRDLRRRSADGFDPVERSVDPGVVGRLRTVVGLDAGGEERADVDPEFSALAREADRVEQVSRLVVEALLDGDMRDAINDGEFDDFEVAVDDSADPDDDVSPDRIARTAQGTLESSVERRFDRFPDDVRASYERAVEASEAHQERDPTYRELLSGARAGDESAVAGVRERYREATFEDPPSGYGERDLRLPYFRTQYGRVGVIYDGMFDMYEAAGVSVDPVFRRAVVLTIVYAQIWLDDVDDYSADVREGQLTPVTGEYVLAADDCSGYRRVRNLAEKYATRAREYADRSKSPLVGVAVEYVFRSGDATVLPGSDGKLS